MSSPTRAATATSYWCYSCSCFVRVSSGYPISCPDCHGGFLELISNAPPPSAGALRRNRTTSSGDSSFPAARLVDSGSRRNRRSSIGVGSLFNPVIVFRGSASDAEAPRANDGHDGNSRFELFYEDGTGTGLRPLPQNMSNFLMGSGFDQLLDQLMHIDSSPVGGGRSGGENTPASKAAIESLPTITITDSHIVGDSCCAICTEVLELDDEAQEMPCKHIFHQDCILPWLSLRNSCPVCRHELPTEIRRRGGDAAGRALMGSGENSAGLTIWRLPGGGFAVGRFNGVRRAGDRELPVVYTEIDRTLSSGGAPRRILWSSRRRSPRENRGVGRMFYNFFSMFRCFGPTLQSFSSSSLRFPSATEESES